MEILGKGVVRMIMRLTNKDAFVVEWKDELTMKEYDKLIDEGEKAGLEPEQLGEILAIASVQPCLNRIERKEQLTARKIILALLKK